MQLTIDTQTDSLADLQGAVSLLTDIIGQRRPTHEPVAPLIEDVLAVFRRDEDRLWSEVIVARLEARWPHRYEGWSPRDLASHLDHRRAGIRSRQIKMRHGGQHANRRGYLRADLEAGL